MTPSWMVSFLSTVGTAVLLAAVGAFLSRWCGGPPWLKAPRLVKRALLAALLALPAFWHLGRPIQAAEAIGPSLGFLWAWAALMLLGMGAYFDLAQTKPEKPHDRVGLYQEEPWVGCWPSLTGRTLVVNGVEVRKVYRFGLRWIFWHGTICGSRRAYEAFALAVTGLATTLGPGLAMVHAGETWRGVALMLAGALKLAGYLIGQRRGKDRDQATEIGEWATGAFWGAAVGATL